MGGQDWSMLTPNRVGISPLPANIFFSQDMDTNYQVGLVWERTPQFRFIYHPTKTAAFGVSLENADQYYGGAGGIGSPVTPNAAAGTAAFSTGQLDTGNVGVTIPNVFPDIIVKAAFDPMISGRDFHFEASGVYSIFRANTFFTSNNSNTNDTESGGGVSANINFALVKNFHLIANSFWSDGDGQKIYGLAPDVVIEPQATTSSPFAIRPLHSGSGIGGAEWQMIPKMMLYGYYGAVYVQRDTYTCQAPGASATTAICGYGIPGTVAAGGTQSITESQNRAIQEGTIGLIPVFWRSPNYGTLQLITQYSYLSRNPWSVPSPAVGLNPRVAHGSLAYVDLRYVLP
jgi:hypothetical protein